MFSRNFQRELESTPSEIVIVSRKEFGSFGTPIPILAALGSASRRACDGDVKRIVATGIRMGTW